MSRKKQQKSGVKFLPIVLILVGAIIFYLMAPIGEILNASDQISLFKVTVDGEAVTDSEFVTEKEMIEVKLIAKRTGIYKFPYDEENYYLEYINGEAPLPYYETSDKDFDMENQIISSGSTSSNEYHVPESPETEPSEVTGVETTDTEIQTPNIEPLPEFAVAKISDDKEPSKGYFYLKLNEGDSLLFNVQWVNTKEQSLIVKDVSNKEKEQTLLTFGKIKEVVKEEISKTNLAESKKEDEREPDPKKSKGMEISIDPLELKGGADVVRLKDPKLIIQTGEKNFDPDDEPGHDSSPSNDIVRTWDKVTYSYSFSIESSSSSKTYKSIRYRVDAELKDSRKKVNGQLRDYAYFPQGTRTGNNATTTRDAKQEITGTVSSSSGIGEGSINLQVLGATNGFELSPTITITIIDAIDADSGETIPINSVSDNLVTKPIKVSAKPNVRALLTNSSEDFNYMSNLTDDMSLNSMAKTMGVKFSVVPLTDVGIIRTGELFEKLFGATYPTGEIKVDVQTSALFKPADGGSSHDIIYGTDQKQPQITHYGFLYGYELANTDNLTKTEEFKDISFKNMNINSPWTMPGSIDTSASKNSKSNVFDTNELSASNKNSDTFSFSVINPAAIHIDDLIDYGGPVKENDGRTTFASIAAVISMPYDYILDKTGTLYTNFKTTSIEYDNNKYNNDSSYVYDRENTLPGTLVTYTPSLNDSESKIGTNTAQQWTPAGDGAVYKGQKFYTRGFYVARELDLKYMTGITAWNANSFEYDTSRAIIPNISSQGATGKINGVFYGIKKDGKVVPDLTVNFENMSEDYTWYTTAEEAMTNGRISAIKSIYEKTGIEARFEARTLVPLKVIGPVNNQAKDSFGNANVTLSSAATYDNSMKQIKTYPVKPTIKVDYVPTIYDINNKIVTPHTPANLYGDTLLIVPFTARVMKTPIRTSYNSDEVVQWKLTPQIEAGDDDTVTFTIKDTLPKELRYLSGSSKYGTQMIEPTVSEEQPDGSTFLTWTIPYHKKEAPIQILTFDTIVNGKNIKYEATNTKNVNNKAIISGINKDGLKDESIEDLREAEASTTITKLSTTVIEKSTSTSKIEIGTNDPALSDVEKNTILKYSLYNTNESKTPAKDFKILDVFPYVSDGRGTTFNGSFDLLSVNVTSTNKPKIYYNKQTVDSSTNPNDIDTSEAWSVYNGGRITDVKAIYLEYDQLDVGEENSIDISLVAKNQKAKDVLVNSAKLDNYNLSPVQSAYVKSTVIDRSVKGIAWYDDNLDGKKNPTEVIVPNISAKLYRTSHENGSYKNELVKANLIGKKFIDDSGNSLIKTNSIGEYQFDHLPEGDYVVYFEIGDDVVAKKYKVTKKDSEPSSQAIDTSKADVTTYKTDSYETPTLMEGNFPDSEWKIQNINIGLVRPSTIRLFKYATGTAIDANGDGKLSEAEKATGTPLKDAEFDIYKGDLEEKLGSAKTDDTGHLEFKPLFEGDYTLVETKAPEGYELIKSPIKVTITEGNQTIKLYQEDDKKTDLPFTGGTGPMFLLLIIVSGMGILGLGGLYWYYRQPSRKGEG